MQITLGPLFNLKPLLKLRIKYRIERLNVRRKRSLLRIMYDKSKDLNNIEDIPHGINLRSRKKVKLKTAFSGLTKIHVSPYYRGCCLWNQLPVEIQKAENRYVFQQQVKKQIL